VNFTFEEVNEGERSDFEKWVLSFIEESEMGLFELDNLIMEVECEGGEGERYMTMVSEKMRWWFEELRKHRKWEWIIHFVLFLLN
jgi:hypothetical protein